MKFIFAFIFAITIGFSASAQMNYSIDLTATSKEHNEQTWKGYSALVKLDDKIVKNVLKDRLKTFGKVQSQKKFWVVTPATISTLSTANVVVYYNKEGKVGEYILNPTKKELARILEANVLEEINVLNKTE